MDFVNLCCLALGMSGTGLLLLFLPYKDVWQAKFMKMLGWAILLVGVALIAFMMVVIVLASRG